MKHHPLVSILCITYNQESYITEAIEGFLMQKTTFPFEIIIGEDCSTDKTREICLSYKNRFPEKIKLISREKNIGARKNFNTTLHNCHGKYVALCEGDDYWTDPYKLQKQVDALENNPQCNLCFHTATISELGHDSRNSFQYAKYDTQITLKNLLKKGYRISTTSILFRSKIISQLPDWFYSASVGDKPLVWFAACQSPIFYINRNMGHYRKHLPGSMSQEIDLKHFEKKIYYIKDEIKILDHIDNHSNKNFSREIAHAQRKLLLKAFIFEHQMDNALFTIPKDSFLRSYYFSLKPRWKYQLLIQVITVLLKKRVKRFLVKKR